MNSPSVAKNSKYILANIQTSAYFNAFKFSMVSNLGNEYRGNGKVFAVENCKCRSEPANFSVAPFFK